MNGMTWFEVIRGTLLFTGLTLLIVLAIELFGPERATFTDLSELVPA